MLRPFEKCDPFSLRAGVGNGDAMSKRVTMKIGVRVVVVILLVVLSVWLADIFNDQAKTVKITDTLPAYNAWECGCQNHLGCSVVFEVDSGAVYDVKRIRYGKDFIAIKIDQSGASGWVFSGKGIRLIDD